VGLDRAAAQAGAGGGEWGEDVTQFGRVLDGQVDLVRDAVQPEGDGFGGRLAVEVVDELVDDPVPCQNSCMACDLVISLGLQTRHGQAASGIVWRRTATYAARFSHLDQVPMCAYGPIGPSTPVWVEFHHFGRDGSRHC
jgi:hypothetical protein